MPPRPAISYCSEQPSNLLLVPKSDVGKSLHRDEFSARGLGRGGGFENLHSVTGCPLVWIRYQKNGLFKEFEDVREAGASKSIAR